jgi:hypothetical protein
MKTRNGRRDNGNNGGSKYRRKYIKEEWRILKEYGKYAKQRRRESGFGGLEDACWPLVHKFAGSNPAEAVGFFRAKKSPARLTSEGK